MTDRMVSVPTAARWLRAHGVSVHVNTVRGWARSGRIPGELVTAGRYTHYRIALSALQRIAACPCCASPSENLQSVAHTPINR